MPKVTAGEGQAVEETTVTRIIPARDKENDRGSTEAIEYMETTPREKWEQGNHIVYLYRVEPPVYRGAPGAAYVTKYSSPITLEQIQQEYGGGLWRIVIKRANERVSDSRYQLSGPARDLTRGTQEFAPGTPGGVSTGDSASLASQAMHLAANPTAQAAQVEMLRTAAVNAIEMVKSNVPQPPPQLSVKEILELAKGLNGPTSVSTEKPFLETEVGKILIAAASALVTALVNRMVAPAADPLDQLSKYAEVIGKFSPAASTNDWKAALVQAAPQLAMSIKDTVQELRLGTEAQMRMNAGRTLTAVSPPPAAPATQPNPSPQNVVEMPASQPQIGAQPMEPFETKLVELLNDPQMTGDKAGEILDVQWPRIVDEVSKYSADQIMQAFQIRPILQPHSQNPRLRQFLTEFLEWANETDTPPLTPNQPAA
jgi:hypothetical protein